MSKNKTTNLNRMLSPAELRDNAMQVTHIGQEILNNSIQKRIDSRTIVLIKKRHIKKQNQPPAIALNAIGAGGG